MTIQARAPASDSSVHMERSSSKPILTFPEGGERPASPTGSSRMTDSAPTAVMHALSPDMLRRVSNAALGTEPSPNSQDGLPWAPFSAVSGRRTWPGR